MNRRAFIGGAFAAWGAWGCRSVFGKREPNLRFGVVSDVHVCAGGRRDHGSSGDTYYFRKAMEYYRAQKVDAVMIAGDIADGGKEAELQEVARAWFEVFPDGCGVEKLFVAGNHDWWGTESVARQKALWEKVWREPYESLWHKTVKGYHFLGKHWEETGFGELYFWLRKNGSILRGEKPFFYVQHPHPMNTCNGEYAWGRDGGLVNSALYNYPNAVVFSGHSHYSQLDERSIWQGDFTSVNTGSLRYGCPPDSGDGPGRWYENGVKGPDDKLMPPANVMETKTGLLVEVYDDAIVYVRRDFQNDRSLGPDWVQPLPANAQAPAMGFAERAAKECPPAFASGATITVKELTAKPRKGEAVPALDIRFPAANAGGARPFVYEIRVTGDGEPLVREVLAEGFDQAPEHPAALGESHAVLAKASLPAGLRTIAVTPVSSLGVRGRPLLCDRIAR